MASIRKKLSMAFGLNSEGPSSTSKASSMDMSRSSMDSGYHSMIARPRRGSQDNFQRATIFTTMGAESSPERSPRKLHKSISTTFSGAMQAFSKTVRSTTSYIYPTAGEPELPSSEWAECETPKKESRRSSIMSSVRSRKQLFTPRSSGAKIESPKVLESPVSVKQEKAPALDVKIPNPFFSRESLEQVSVSSRSQLPARVKLPAGPKNLWPGPTRLTVDQASENDRQAILPPASTKFEDPYVEQGDKLQSGLSFINSSSEFVLEPPSPETNRRYMTDDKGYFSEIESNADDSESEGLSPACLSYVAPGSPEAKTNSPCHHSDPAASHIHVASSTSPWQRKIPSRVSSSMPSESEAPMPKALDDTAEHNALLGYPSRRSSHGSSQLENGLSALSPTNDAAITSESGSFHKRLTSDVYDADAESLKTSMGSRTAWERHRADRERRYMEIFDMIPDTESDEEVGPELELKRSPSKKSVQYVEELVQNPVDAGRFKCTSRYPTGDLRYAVEAIERPAFPVGDFAYAVEAIERPSITTFDPLETVFQQRPMLCLSDWMDESKTLKARALQDVSPSRMENSSSPIADPSPSRVKLPSSSESSPVGIPAAPEFTMMMTKLTDEELMAFGAGDLDGQSLRQYPSESTVLAANYLPKRQSRTAPEDAFEAGLNAGGRVVPMDVSMTSKTNLVGEDTYQAILRAAGIFMPSCASDSVQARPEMDENDRKATSIFAPILNDTSHGTFHEQLEVGSTLPKQRSRNGTPFGHGRAVSALSDDTDDSCAITPYSPLCNAPPPFPSLHFRSEPARRIPSAVHALTTYGDEQVRLVGPANAGIDLSLSPPFDCPGDQNDGAGSKLFDSKALKGADSPKNHTQASLLQQYNIQSPSPGTASSIQSPSNSNNPQETFNAAKLPRFASPSALTSRKARRKQNEQKKRSSGMGTVPFADVTMNSRNTLLAPELSPPKRDFIEDSAIDKRQKSPDKSPKTTEGGVQKSSSHRQLDRKNRSSRDQSSFEEFTETIEDSFRWVDTSSKSKRGKSSPAGRGQAATTVPMRPSPPRMRMPQVTDNTLFDEVNQNVGNAVEGPKSHSEPEFSIKHFDSMSDVVSWYANGRSDSNSYVGHELEGIFLANPPKHSDKKAVRFASTDETIGHDSDSTKDSPCGSSLKRKGKPPLGGEKFAVQKELERKSDRAWSRLVDKLKGETLVNDQIREDGSAQKGA